MLVFFLISEESYLAEKDFKGGLYFGKTPDPSKEMEARGSRKKYNWDLCPGDGGSQVGGVRKTHPLPQVATLAL